MSSSNKEEIEIPVDKDRQDKDFIIHRMFITAVPYEEGHHCAFYAIQDALLHFNQKALKLEDRDRFQIERKKQVDSWKASSGLEEKRGAWMEISLAFLLPKLAKEGIVPVKFVCTEDSKELIENLKEVKGSLAPFLTEEGEADLEFPALYFLERSDGPHVWFCPDEETFDKDEALHRGVDGHYTLMIPLKKA